MQGVIQKHASWCLPELGDFGVKSVENGENGCEGHPRWTYRVAGWCLAEEGQKRPSFCFLGAAGIHKNVQVVFPHSGGGGGMTGWKRRRRYERLEEV